MTTLRNLLLILACISITPLIFGMSKKQQQPTTPVASTAEERMWVAKSNQAKSCEQDEGISLMNMNSELEKIGVKTFEQKTIHDENLHIMMCGSDKGELNAFLIDKKSLDKAIKAGFNPLPAR